MTFEDKCKEVFLLFNDIKNNGMLEKIKEIAKVFIANSRRDLNLLLL